ncbi:hypothetical protein ScPMuIL_002124 [Solemya velum]
MNPEEFGHQLFTVHRGVQGAGSHYDVDMATHLPVTPLPKYTDWHSPLDRKVLSGGRFPGDVDTNIVSSIYPSNYVSQNLLVRRRVGLSCTCKRNSGVQQSHLSYTGQLHSLASCMVRENYSPRNVSEWRRYSPSQNAPETPHNFDACLLTDMAVNLQESGYISGESNTFTRLSEKKKTNPHHAVLGHLSDRGDAPRQDVHSHHQLRLVRDEYGLPVILGKGSFGEVRLASYGNKKMAVKYFTRQYSKLEDVVNEYEILQHLEGTGCVPKLPSLIETDPDDPDFCGLALGMEAIDGVTLDEYLWKHPNISNLEWIEIAMQIVSAISKIHKKGVLINDIKTNNIMITKQGNKHEVKIIDFGLATIDHGLAFKNTSTMSEFMHLAPEVRCGVESDQCSDVFSLGVVLDTILAFTEIEELRIPTEVCVQAEPAERISASGARRLLQLIRDEMLIGECAS